MPSLNNIAKEVAERLGIPPQLVLNTYKAFCKHIKTSIESLPLKEDITEEEFKSYKTNYNLPYIGKLYCNYDDLEKAKKTLKYKNNDRHQHKED